MLCVRSALPTVRFEQSAIRVYMESPPSPTKYSAAPATDDHRFVEAERGRARGEHVHAAVGIGTVFRRAALADADFADGVVETSRVPA